MSMWADYLKEREGKHVLETLDGFAVYEYLPTHCYIIDIYVRLDARKSGAASAIADQIVSEARGKGYTKLLGSVRPSANGSTTSLKVLLAYGFKLLSADKDAILFEKDI